MSIMKPTKKEIKEAIKKDLPGWELSENPHQNSPTKKSVNSSNPDAPKVIAGWDPLKGKKLNTNTETTSIRVKLKNGLQEKVAEVKNGVVKVVQG